MKTFSVSVCLVLAVPALVSAQGNDVGSKLMTIGYDGSAQHVVYEIDDIVEAPKRSPDGKWIVGLLYPLGTTEHPRGVDVIHRRTNPSGGHVVDLYSFYVGQGTTNVPAWSLNSKRFAFVKYSN